MDYSDFFWLQHGDEAAEADVLTEPLGYKLACSISRGEHEIDAPLKVKVRRGGVDTILNTDGTMLHLCSTRFVSLLRERGFTGWKTYSVQSSRNGKTSDISYAGLVATGRCGDIDDALAPRVQKQYRPGDQGFEYCVGQFFNIDTWDGSDIFVPGNAQYLYATRSVMEAVRESGLEGCSFKPISEIERLV